MRVNVNESIGDLLYWATEALNDGSFEDPAIEAHFLLGGLLEKSPTDVYLSKKAVLDEETARHYRDLVLRRKKHTPAAYLLGRKNFMGFDFEVNPFVLIPRPETELLVEWAIHRARQLKNETLHVLEIGTGSGCISTLLAKSFPRAQITATDILSEVLQTAERNAERLFLSGKVRFLSSNLYEELGPEFRGVYDMIISNPPYVTRSEYEFLDADVKDHEPRRALLGGDDGLEIIRPLIAQGFSFLKPGGQMILEIGYRQADAVRELFKSNGFIDIEIRQDFGGHDRMIAARKGQ
jgi:release factor glutamine methyltransferase